MLFRLPRAARAIENPSPEDARSLAARMATAQLTRHGNLNVQTEVLARSSASTFIVTDSPDVTHQAISTEEGARWAEAQDSYIAGLEMIQVDGYIGIDPEYPVV